MLSGSAKDRTGKSLAFPGKLVVNVAIPKTEKVNIVWPAHSKGQSPNTLPTPKKTERQQNCAIPNVGLQVVSALHTLPNIAPI